MKKFTFYLSLSLFSLSQNYGLSCWLDPSFEKNKFPKAWEYYNQALDHAKYANSWSTFDDPQATYTFYMAYKCAEGTIRSIDEYNRSEASALRSHAYFLSSELCYLADPVLKCNYEEVCKYLEKASNLEDSNQHTQNTSEEFLISDTNYEWLIKLAETQFEIKHYSESLYTAFLCFKRIMLYGQMTPWYENQRASAALKLCHLISRNYFALYKETDQEEYLHDELHALELFLNIAFNNEEGELYNPHEDEYYTLEEISNYSDDLQEDADNIFYFYNTHELSNLRSHVYGYQCQELALKVIFRRARISLLGGYLDDAIHYYQLAAKYFPDSGEAYAHLGNMYFIKKSYHKAYEYFQLASSHKYNATSILKIMQLSEQLKTNEHTL